MSKIVDDFDIVEYHKMRKTVSASMAKTIRRSPRDFCYWVLKPYEQKSYFDFGNAFELALTDFLFGGTRFDDKVVSFEDSVLVDSIGGGNPRGTKAYKAEKTEFFEAHRSKYIIMDKGAESRETIDFMLKSLDADDTIKRLLEKTDYQKSLFWEDPDTGVKCKTRPDFCKTERANIIVDVKTGGDVDPHNFKRSIQNYDYGNQAMFQIEGCINTGLMENVDKYYWVVFSKVPPYHAVIYSMTDEDRIPLKVKYLDLLHKAKKCFEHLDMVSTMEDLYNVPSYGYDHKHGIIDLKLPSWYLTIN